MAVRTESTRLKGRADGSAVRDEDLVMDGKMTKNLSLGSILERAFGVFNVYICVQRRFFAPNFTVTKAFLFPFFGGIYVPK